MLARQVFQLIVYFVAWSLRRNASMLDKGTNVLAPIFLRTSWPALNRLYTVLVLTPPRALAVSSTE
jgi:hypothetical protein